MSIPRKDKICKYCGYFMPEVDSVVNPGSKVEAECTIDEDIDSEEFCESFERKQ